MCACMHGDPWITVYGNPHKQRYGISLCHAHCPAISKIICWGSQQFLLTQQYACPTFTQCHAFTHSTQWVTPGNNIEWYSPSWFLTELVIHPSSCGQHKLSQHKRVKDGHFWMLCISGEYNICQFTVLLQCSTCSGQGFVNLAVYSTRLYTN